MRYRRRSFGRRRAGYGFKRRGRAGRRRIGYRF